jgi:cobalt-precorrin-5B (C1)-methyltransferase
MMSKVVTALCDEHGVAPDIEIEISIENGAELALKTWNPRLGIVGGLSVLGTTGVVHPFSCSAWIHSIHRGIDVARAEGLTHVLGATGSTSEKTAQEPTIVCPTSPVSTWAISQAACSNICARIRCPADHSRRLRQAHQAGARRAGSAFRPQPGRYGTGWLRTRCEAGCGSRRCKKRILAANTALEVLELTRDAGLDLPMRRSPAMAP